MSKEKLLEIPLSVLPSPGPSLPTVFGGREGKGVGHCRAHIKCAPTLCLPDGRSSTTLCLCPYLLSLCPFPWDFHHTFPALKRAIFPLTYTKRDRNLTGLKNEMD